MATNSKVFVSPGVYTSERDLSFVAQSVGVTTLGIVGETLKGPAFEPIFITNYDEFQAYFGGTTPEKFVNTQIPKYEAAYIAKSYLQQSNQLFVTRVLGLSGYDAGPSWSIKTIANVDVETVAFVQSCSGSPIYSPAPACIITCDPPVPVAFTVEFSGTAGQDGSIVLTNWVGGNEIQVKLDDTYTKFNGGTSTLREDINAELLTVFGSPAKSSTTISYFGTIWETEYFMLASAYTSSTNVFSVDNVCSKTAKLSSRLNDAWYYSLFDNFSGNSYSGFSFFSVVDTLVLLPKATTTTTTAPTTTTTTYNPCNPGGGGGGSVTTTTTTEPDSFSGTVTGLIYQFTGDSYVNYNNLIVATMRSRGISNFNTTQHGPLYEVSELSNVALDFSGSYMAVEKNPYAAFGINITGDSGTVYSFKASMNPNIVSYLPKVLGTDNFSKPKTEVPLFVESRFDSMVSWAYKKGYIRGLRQELTSFDSARSNLPANHGFYAEQYKSPESPWVVSELRGSVVYRLFKVVSVSDGDSANHQIKISFVNMSFDNNNFDVLVRDFYDTDESPVVLEKFTNCSMDSNLNSFIAKKIGTSNGDYSLNSKYIMLEMNEDAPTDSLPCGFEGYRYQVFNENNPPFPVYKTKYTYPGEQVFNPPFGYSDGTEDATTSRGDNVRRTYLGLSTNVDSEYDVDFFDYIGKINTGTIENPTLSDWNFLTKGFHMDSGATSILISGDFTTSGQPAYACGISDFRFDPIDENNPYYRIFARKFTIMVAGGFDGWDIYRESRTNTDKYILGKSGYLGGAAPDARYPSASGVGLFKRIQIEDNTVDWANTDYYAYLLGQRTFSHPESTNINVFVTPGIDYINNLGLVNQAINLVEINRADSLYIVTTPDYDMFAPNTMNSMDFHYPQDAVDLLAESQIDSNYTATYYPWVLTRDNVNNTQIYIPATAEVCRNLALTDNIAFPWFASAGYTRGLVNAIKARRKLTQEDRDTLYIGRINPIATFSDVGTVIWGNKTLQVAESALNRINVRRLLLQARKLISAVAVRLLFEQNDQKVRQDFLDAVNPILDAIRRDRGLYDFRVTVSNSLEDFDKNQLVGKIYVKPTKSLEFIDIEFLITPTGASFEDI